MEGGTLRRMLKIDPIPCYTCLIIYLSLEHQPQCPGQLHYITDHQDVELIVILRPGSGPKPKFRIEQNL